ncbi:unnamed protein product, partial [Mesorhabditis spiculigera]
MYDGYAYFPNNYWETAPNNDTLDQCSSDGVWMMLRPHVIFVTFIYSAAATWHGKQKAKSADAAQQQRMMLGFMKWFTAACSCSSLVLLFQVLWGILDVFTLSLPTQIYYFIPYTAIAALGDLGASCCLIAAVWKCGK